jgi:hypothetical protein
MIWNSVLGPDFLDFFIDVVKPFSSTISLWKLLSKITWYSITLSFKWILSPSTYAASLYLTFAVSELVLKFPKFWFFDTQDLQIYPLFYLIYHDRHRWIHKFILGVIEKLLRSYWKWRTRIWIQKLWVLNTFGVLMGGISAVGGIAFLILGVLFLVQ